MLVLPKKCHFIIHMYVPLFILPLLQTDSRLRVVPQQSVCLLQKQKLQHSVETK